MKLVLSDVELLKLPIKTISELIDEGIFTVNSDGFQFLAADRAMVAMVEFKLLPTAFDEFEVDKEYELGLNIENFADILNRASKKDKVILELENKKLNIIFEGRVKRKFEVPLLDISREELPDVSQLEFSSKVEVSTEIIEEAVKDIDLVAESLVFEVNNDKFLIYGGGEGTSSIIEINKNDPDIYNFEADSNVKSRYPLDYIKKIMNISSLVDTLTIEIGNDYPCRISSKLLDKVYIAFIVAPRVE